MERRVFLVILASLLLTLTLSPGRAPAAPSAWLERDLLSSPATLASGEIRLDLGAWHRVQRLVIDAEAIGQDALVEVQVNGDVKGTLYLPGRDPRYVVTVAESARTITLRHMSGGQARLYHVMATLSQGHGNPPDHGQGADVSVAADVAERIIHAVDDLHPYVAAAAWEASLLPVKIQAGRTYALSSASGDLSQRVQQALQSLLVDLDLAQPVLDQCLADPTAFDVTVALLKIRHEIYDLLN